MVEDIDHTAISFATLIIGWVLGLLTYLLLYFYSLALAIFAIGVVSSAVGFFLQIKIADRIEDVSKKPLVVLTILFIANLALIPIAWAIWWEVYKKAIES